MPQIALTGIKPTATPHLGNYLGAIRTAVRLTESYRTLFFIADYHALTSLRDPDLLTQYVYDVAATWLACGVDPRTTMLYRQSDIPEVFELAWIFSCLVATGQLERGHAYKDALAKGAQAKGAQAKGSTTKDGPTKGGTVNAGVFNYPLLMAADIILYGAHVVPVGKDQQQHLEVARDVAIRFNHTFQDDILVVPEGLITDAPVVPGTDGEKMSKSRGNTVPLFSQPKATRKVLGGIKTGSEPLEVPKEAVGNTVFELYKLMATPEDALSMRQKLAEGGYGWGHAKQELADLLEQELGPFRDTYHQLRTNTEVIDEILQDGAERARTIALETMERVRFAVGVSRRGIGGSGARKTTENMRRKTSRRPGSKQQGS